MKGHGLVKSFSTSLAIIYLVTNCAFAHKPETTMWEERHRALNEAKTNFQLAQLPLGPSSPSTQIFRQLPSITPSLPQRIEKSVPKSAVSTLIPIFSNLSTTFGTVRCVSLPAGENPKKIVIHIQDVHMNQEAQKNIGATLQELINQKKVDIIALEGAFAPIDLTPFRRFPHHDTISKVADYLLRENKISGPVHTAFTSPAEIPPVVGIDDKTHYDANVEAYRQSAPLIKPYKKKLKDIERQLSDQKSKTFNSELLTFDRQVESYRKAALTMGDYIELLSKRIACVPQTVETFLEALKLERSLDFVEVEQERSSLLSELLAKLNKTQTSELINMSVAFRTGNLSHADFYHYLQNLCEKSGVALSRFPGMSAYLRYVLLSDGIDAEKLFESLKQMEDEAYVSLVKTSDEKNLIAKSRRLYLTGKLLDFALTKEEWAEYKSLKPDDHGLNLKSFEAFYREADARDQAMSANLLKAMEDHRAKVAVLVTGGFHSQGMDALFHEQGVTNVTFVPKITKADNENGSAYLSVFAQEKTPLEKLVQGEKLFLAFQTALPIEDGQVSLLARALDPAAKTLVPNRFEITDVEHTEHHHDIKVTNKGSGLREEITAEDYLDQQINVSVRLIGVSVASILLSILTWMTLDQIGWGIAANFVAVIVGIIALFNFSRWQGLQLPITFGEIQIINGIKITVPVWRGWLAEPMYMTGTPEPANPNEPQDNTTNTSAGETPSPTEFNPGHGDRAWNRLMKEIRKLEQILRQLNNTLSLQFVNLLHHAEITEYDLKWIINHDHFHSYELPSRAVEAFLKGQPTKVTQNVFWVALLNRSRKFLAERKILAAVGVDVSQIRQAMRRMTYFYLNMDFDADKQRRKYFIKDGVVKDSEDPGFGAREDIAISRLSPDHRNELARNKLVFLNAGDQNPFIGPHIITLTSDIILYHAPHASVRQTMTQILSTYSEKMRELGVPEKDMTTFVIESFFFQIFVLIRDHMQLFTMARRFQTALKETQTAGSVFQNQKLAAKHFGGAMHMGSLTTLLSLGLSEGSPIEMSTLDDPRVRLLGGGHMKGSPFFAKRFREIFDHIKLENDEFIMGPDFFVRLFGDYIRDESSRRSALEHLTFEVLLPACAELIDSPSTKSLFEDKLIIFSISGTLAKLSDDDLNQLTSGIDAAKTSLKKVSIFVSALSKPAYRSDPDMDVLRRELGVGLLVARADKIKDPEAVYGKVKLLNRAIKLASTKDSLIYLLIKKGEALLMGQEDEAAEKSFDKVLKWRPDHGVANYYKGQVFERADRHELAVQSFEKALVNLTNDYAIADSLFSLGWNCEKIGKYDEAIEFCQKAIAKNPKDARPRALLGQIFYKQKKFSDAVAEFEGAVNTVPNDSALWTNLGLATEALGDLDRAQAAYQKVVEVGHNSPAIARGWNGLGVIHSKRQDYLNAKKAYEAAIELDPEQAFYWNNLGITCEKISDFNGAHQAYLRASKIHPVYLPHLVGFGENLYRHKYFKEAAEAFEEALGITPTATTWYQLALAREALGEKENARAAYETALALDPAHTESQVRLQNLNASPQRDINPLTLSATYARYWNDPRVLAIRETEGLDAARRYIEIELAPKDHHEIIRSLLDPTFVYFHGNETRKQALMRAKGQFVIAAPFWIANVAFAVGLFFIARGDLPVLHLLWIIPAYIAIFVYSIFWNITRHRIHNIKNPNAPLTFGGSVESQLAAIQRKVKEKQEEAKQYETMWIWNLRGPPQIRRFMLGLTSALLMALGTSLSALYFLQQNNFLVASLLIMSHPAANFLLSTERAISTRANMGSKIKWRFMAYGIAVVLLIIGAEVLYRFSIPNKPAVQEDEITAPVTTTQKLIVDKDKISTYVNQKLEASLPIENTLRRVIKEDDQLIFFGERHTHNIDYPALIRIVKKINPQLDALLIEGDEAYQEAIDEYMSGKKSYEDSIGKTFNLKEFYFPLLVLADQKFLNIAKELNLKIYAVDLRSTRQNDSNRTRDLYMANSITKLYKDGKFKYAVMPVGRFHLNSGEDRKFMPEYLLDFGQVVRFRKINILSSEATELVDWAREKSIKDKVGFGYLTPVSDPPVKMNAVLINEKEAITSWNAFDATIIMPQGSLRKIPPAPGMIGKLAESIFLFLQHRFHFSQGMAYGITALLLAIGEGSPFGLLAWSFGEPLWLIVASGLFLLSAHLFLGIAVPDFNGNGLKIIRVQDIRGPPNTSWLVWLSRVLKTFSFPSIIAGSSLLPFFLDLSANSVSYALGAAIAPHLVGNLVLVLTYFIIFRPSSPTNRSSTQRSQASRRGSRSTPSPEAIVFNRRDFLRQGLAAIGAVAAASLWPTAFPLAP